MKTKIIYAVVENDYDNQIIGPMYESKEKAEAEVIELNSAYPNEYCAYYVDEYVLELGD